MSNSMGCMNLGWRHSDSKSSKKSKNQSNQENDKEKTQENTPAPEVTVIKPTQKVTTPQEMKQSIANADSSSSNSSTTLKSSDSESTDDDKETKNDNHLIKSSASLDETVMRKDSDVQNKTKKTARPMSEDDSMQLDALLEELTSLTTNKEKPRARTPVDSFDLIQKDLDRFQMEYKNQFKPARKPATSSLYLNSNHPYDENVSNRSRPNYGQSLYENSFQPIGRFDRISPGHLYNVPYSPQYNSHLNFQEADKLKPFRSFSTGSQPNINQNNGNNFDLYKRGSLNRMITPSSSVYSPFGGRWPDDFLNWSDEQSQSMMLSSVDSERSNRLGFGYGNNHQGKIIRPSYSEVLNIPEFGTNDGDYETEENLRMGNQSYYSGVSEMNTQQNTSYFRSAHATLEQEREVYTPVGLVEEFETVEMLPIGQGVQTFKNNQKNSAPPRSASYLSTSNSRMATMPAGRPPLNSQRTHYGSVARTQTLPPGSRNMRGGVTQQYIQPQQSLVLQHVHHFENNRIELCSNPNCLGSLGQQLMVPPNTFNQHQQSLEISAQEVAHRSSYVDDPFDDVDAGVSRHRFESERLEGRRRVDPREQDRAQLIGYNKIDPPVRDEVPSWTIQTSNQFTNEARDQPLIVSSSQKASQMEAPMKTIELVNKTKMIWYKPNLTRDEAFNLLRNSKSGTFVVRSSSSFQNSYGLAVKVDRIPEEVQLKSNDPQELVRHYLIEKGQYGVRVRGDPEEPQFKSLEYLIEDHSLRRISLPVKLRLPQLPNNRESLIILPKSDLGIDMEIKPPTYSSKPSKRNGYQTNNNQYKTWDQVEVTERPQARLSHSKSHSTSGETYRAHLIGLIYIENLSGEVGLVKALDKIQRERKYTQTECELNIGPDGLQLTDHKRKYFFREQHHWRTISFVGSTSKEWNLDPPKGRQSSKVFGFIINSAANENKAYLFAELDSPSYQIVNAASKYLPTTQITAL